MTSNVHGLTLSARPTFGQLLRRHAPDRGAGLLLLLALSALTLRLASYPAPWFDEGYKTNAARTLAERGVYGTATASGYLPFDPGISSGPADIVPVALAFRLFGPGILAARLVIVGYALLGLAALAALARWLYGDRAALLTVLVLLAGFPGGDVSYVRVGRQVLGEMPALALMLVGLGLWFRSWRTGRMPEAGLAGLLVGLGLLSKQQVAIALLPTLGAVALGRSAARRTGHRVNWLPAVTATAVLAGWSWLGRYAVSAAVESDNSRMLDDAIRSNLVTDVATRSMPNTAWAIVGLLLLAGLASVWRVRGRLWRDRGGSDRAWAEATLGLFVLLTALWYAGFSVGWPRYAFAGVVVATLPLGKLGGDAGRWAGRWLRKRGVRRAPLYPAAAVALIILALGSSLAPLLSPAPASGLDQMAAYVDAHVAPEAVVESWEWELDAQTQHWQFHHPHQRYLFLAIRQTARGQRPLRLGYDPLQADPAYLLVGPFAAWTGIYDGVSPDAFHQVAAFGAYRLLERSR